MNITILGAGAIGSLWAYKLQQAGHKLNIIVKQKAQSSLEIALDTLPAISFSANSQKALTECDLLLVTLKSWQVKQALTPLLDKLAPETIILLMHNGMGAIDELNIQHQPVVLATTTHGAYRSSRTTTSNHILHTGMGTTVVGGHNDLGRKCNFLPQVLQHALPTASWSDNIQYNLWLKLAINCAINPLTAINQCKNGQLAGAKYQPIIAAVLDEIYQVLCCEQINISRNQLTQSVNSVIKATADNFSSMQQDIAHQRRTEIDYITGYLCRTAEKHQTPIEQNIALYQQIKLLEQNQNQQPN